MIGNTVNLAAGLESLTKVFHAGVVVSEYTVQQLQDPSRFFLREIDRVRVKGKSDPVVIYELFDTDPPRIRDKKQKMVPELTAALVFYKMGAFERCLEALKRCAAVFDEDPIVHIYRERCERLMAAPPSEKWDGVTSLTA